MLSVGREVINSVSTERRKCAVKWVMIMTRLGNKFFVGG